MMRRFLVAFFIGCLLAIPVFIAGERVLNAKEEQQQEVNDESSFWSMFRKAFSRPEPAYKRPAKGSTEVAGLRALEEGGELKEKYDYDSVQWMEQYHLNEEHVKDFIESRNLGPYQK
jgi:hypothetical protein